MVRVIWKATMGVPKRRVWVVVCISEGGDVSWGSARAKRNRVMERNMSFIMTAF